MVSTLTQVERCHVAHTGPVWPDLPILRKRNTEIQIVMVIILMQVF